MKHSKNLIRKNVSKKESHINDKWAVQKLLRYIGLTPINGKRRITFFEKKRKIISKK